MKQDRLVAPWLRSSMMYEQGREQHGFYRKQRTVKEMGALTFTIWAFVIVAAVLALIMTGHHEEEMTKGVNRKEVMKWAGNEDAGFWVQRELFVLRDCANADRVYRQLQEMSK